MGAKSSPDDDEGVLQVSEAIIRRVKWSYKSLLGRRGLKMLRWVRKTTFSRSPPGQSLCQWRQKGVSRPNWGGVAADFHDAQLENQTSDRLRIGGNLSVTNSSIDCESFISGLSSPLRRRKEVKSWVWILLKTTAAGDFPFSFWRDLAGSN